MTDVEGAAAVAREDPNDHKGTKTGKETRMGKTGKGRGETGTRTRIGIEIEGETRGAEAEALVTTVVSIPQS